MSPGEREARDAPEGSGAPGSPWPPSGPPPPTGPPTAQVGPLSPAEPVTVPPSPLDTGGGGPSRGLLVAVAVVAAAVLGVGAYLFFFADDDDGGDVAADDRPADAAEEEDGGPTTTPAEELTFTTITDDTGRLVVEVPDSWTDVDGTPISEASPNVQASAAIDAMLRFEASGIDFTLRAEPNLDPDASLDALTAELAASCAFSERQDYDDNVFAGRLAVFSDCAGRPVTVYVIAAANAAGQFVEVTTVVVPPDPAEAIETRIVETFNVR